MLVSATVLLLPLPIPFSNTFPGWVILLVAGGLLVRDGLALLLAHVVFITGVAYFIFLGGATRELLKAAQGGMGDWTFAAPLGLPPWFWVHGAATLALVAVIWVVQRVIYPGFARRAGETFPAWHQTYTRRITWVVAPLMVTELATGLWWVGREPLNLAAWSGLGLIVAVWAVTAWVQVRQHRQLAHGFEPKVHRRLVRGNWWRTGLWSVRGVLLAALVLAA
jgi:hypothetical protein